MPDGGRSSTGELSEPSGKDVKGWAATKAEFRKGTGVSRLSDGKGKIGEASETGGGNMGREGKPLSRTSKKYEKEEAG